MPGYKSVQWRMHFTVTDTELKYLDQLVLGFSQSYVSLPSAFEQLGPGFNHVLKRLLCDREAPRVFPRKKYLAPFLSRVSHGLFDRSLQKRNIVLNFSNAEKGERTPFVKK